MNQVIVSDGFLHDMLQVETSQLEAAIFDALDLLPYAPALGSRRLPDSVARAFGRRARKLSVPPFDVIYVVIDDGDYLILGLIHQRAAR